MKIDDTKPEQTVPVGMRLVCTPRVWRKHLNRYVYAHEYGKKAFCFLVKN